VRYYERAGLLQPLKRRRIIIGRTQAMPFTPFVSSVPRRPQALPSPMWRTFLALRAGDMALCKDVQPLIAKRVQDVSARIQEMQQVLTVLASVSRPMPCPGTG